MNYNIVAQTTESTVVAEYTPLPRKADAYQSEAALEKELISLLTAQGYEYLAIHDEKALITNLRKQLELLNGYVFSDSEWEQFFSECIAGKNDGIVEKTRRIQDDYIQILRRDNGSTKNIYLVDKRNIHNNRLQVINQYTTAEGTHKNRYDVTVLVNGLPMVYISNSNAGASLFGRRSIDQPLPAESFCGLGAFEYVQIFVISNGTNTKYYSNSTRFNHIREAAASGKSGKGKTSHSFEFTSFWADAQNRIIPDLMDFTKTFFSKHTLLNLLTRYCVFTAENMLLVMRPYQIAATERILSKLEIANNYKTYGTIAGGGYIWHTTGSGKTLTSFKTAQIASKLPYIDKVLFVVDRKDLDYQTMKEYDRFEKGAANSNTSTAVLQRQLEVRDRRGNPHAYKIIITTIQKLSTFIKKNPTHAVYQKRVVIIFDECHRSQFGDMHTAITKHFKKYHLFGFTGTPIFAVNAPHNGKPTMKTTPQVFGGEPDKDGKRVLPLHTYTIVDAINDKNVLPFRVDYIKPWTRNRILTTSRSKTSTGKRPF
ncbi:MAG: type I restriction endonuclease subunit R [Acutalibacteraceae bacterium]